MRKRARNDLATSLYLAADWKRGKSGNFPLYFLPSIEILRMARKMRESDLALVFCGLEASLFPFPYSPWGQTNLFSTPQYRKWGEFQTGNGSCDKLLLEILRPENWKRAKTRGLWKSENKSSHFHFLVSSRGRCQCEFFSKKFFRISFASTHDLRTPTFFVKCCHSKSGLIFRVHHWLLGGEKILPKTSFHLGSA